MNEYEDYMYGMRNYNMMGYNMNDTMNCNYMNPNCMGNNFMSYNNMSNNMNSIESMYPEIYNKIYPMIIKTCDSIRYTNMGSNIISKSMLNDLTDNIYFNLEDEDRSAENQMESDDDSSTCECRDRRPNTLRDLIRILLIRELLRRGYNTYSPYGYRPY